MTSLFFYLLILITAILTIKTDISEKKIYNSHLLPMGVIALLAYLILFISRKPPVTLNYFIINCALSISIGFTLYFANLWRAGDAKLFFVYSLLIASKKTNPAIPIPCIELFFNMFLLASLFLIPSILATIAKKRNTQIAQLSIDNIMGLIIKTLMVTLGLSWLVFPVLRVFEIRNNPFINSLIIYMGFLLLYKAFNIIKNKTIGILVFLAGFILRFILIPININIFQILIFLKTIILIALVYYPIRIFIETDKEKVNRVPFAPFMFLGAALSYTGFLNLCMRIVTAITR